MVSLAVSNFNTLTLSQIFKSNNSVIILTISNSHEIILIFLSRVKLLTKLVKIMRNKVKM